MKKKYLLFFMFLNSTIIFLAGSCCSTGDEARQAKAIISKHVVTFKAPPKRIPSQFSVDAPLLGNGFTGIAISGAPETQVFYVARNDFWRLKSALDEAFPAVLGKIELSIPQLENATYLVEQNLWNATTVAHFSKDNRTVYYKAYLSATEDVFVVEVGMKGPGSMDGKVALSLPGEKEIHVALPLERKFPYSAELKSLENGTSYLFRAFEDSVDIKTKAAISLKVLDSGNGGFSVKEGQPAVFVCAFSSNFKSENCVDDVIKKVEGYTSKKQLAELEKAHEDWWENYWLKSYVSIPDTIIEKQYYLSLYGSASCSRDPRFPSPIFGTWITSERPAWNGDYHLNYNHEAPYYALYSANRTEQADPYYAPLLEQIARGKYYSEKVTGIKDGIMLPVGIGPLGIEPTRRSPFMDKYYRDWIESGNVEDEGMFWGQKSNSAYAVVDMSMQFYRTWDVAFAEKVYPFVKGVAVFWKGYLKQENGRYVIYNDAIHEGTIGNKNPLLSLGLVRMVMQTAIDMSALLGIDKDLRAQWTDINTHISGYPLQGKDGKTVFRYTEEGVAWWNDNTLGIQHIYPAGQIGLDSDPELLRVAYNTVDVMQRWIDNNGSNSFFPAAVRVGYNPDTILAKLRLYSRHTYGNGFQLNNPHGIENWSTVPNTVNEMLCMGHQGVIRVFPVWPKDKDAFFHHIRVEGAFLVSSELRNGDVTELSIVSEKGRELHLQNPWPQKKVKIMENGAAQETVEGDRLTVKTKANASYRFVPVQ